MNVKQIEQAALHLSKDDLLRLRNRIDSLLAVGGDAPKANGSGNGKTVKRQEESFERRVVQTVVKTLAAYGIPSLPGRSHSATKILREFAPQLQAYLKKVSDDRRDQDYMLRVGVDCLYRNLLQMNVPITCTTVLNNIHRLPAAVDTQFPGYAANGLLSFVVRSRAHSQTIKRM